MDKIKKISWTEDGYSSFADIVDYIAQDSPFYAGNFSTFNDTMPLPFSINFTGRLFPGV